MGAVVGAVVVAVVVAVAVVVVVGVVVGVGVAVVVGVGVALMFPSSDASDYEHEPRRSLATWLHAWSEPKLRADLDAPPPLPDHLVGVCGTCGGSGVRSEHALPAPYASEPCSECAERPAVSTPRTA